MKIMRLIILPASTTQRRSNLLPDATSAGISSAVPTRGAAASDPNLGDQLRARCHVHGREGGGQRGGEGPRDKFISTLAGLMALAANHRAAAGREGGREEGIPDESERNK